MKVLVEVPKSIEDRFQFIPESKIPGILARLIQVGLESTGTHEEKESTQDFTELLEAIRSIQVKDVPVQDVVDEEVSGGSWQELKVSKVESKPLIDDNSELGDFMDLLK